MSEEGRTTVRRIQKRVYPLKSPQDNYTGLLRHIGDARFVLIGGGTHGTQEFYEARAWITRLLIEQHGFSAVAVDAGCPDAYRVNRFVQGAGRDASAREALDDFSRFPSWLWCNSVVEQFIDWLRDYNRGGPAEGLKTGFYGLDLYNLNSAVDAVITYLDKAGPEAARRLRDRYSSFEHPGEASRENGYARHFDLSPGLENEVLEKLSSLRSKAYQSMQRDGFLAGDESFFAGLNARAASNAEAFYRLMLEDDVKFWNMRERHMLQTLTALAAHLKQAGKSDRIVVWAHNVHAGDARATGMARRGAISLGQQLRKHFPRDTILIGQTTYTGSVSAASTWGAPVEKIDLSPAPVGSFENLFHSAGIPNFYLLLDTGAVQEDLADLNNEMLERLTGAVYPSQAGHNSQYFSARLMGQFNIVLHFDQTSALTPLKGAAGEEAPEAPLSEPYPG